MINLLILLFILLFPVMVLAQTWGYWGIPFGFLGSFIMLVVWVAIIIGVFYLAVYLIGEHRKGNNRAIEILKERYAKGEITKEEYERMLEDLRR